MPITNLSCIREAPGREHRLPPGAAEVRLLLQEVLDLVRRAVRLRQPVPLVVQLAQLPVKLCLCLLEVLCT
jgi:hypothetical protein